MPRTFTPEEWLTEHRRQDYRGDFAAPFHEALAAWEKDREDAATLRRMWETDRARIATLEAEADRLRAQRDALVPVARVGAQLADGFDAADDKDAVFMAAIRAVLMTVKSEDATARTALAAIEAETTTTTEQTDG